MELNKEIQLKPDSLLDVNGVLSTQRLLYFKQERKVILKGSVKNAMLDKNEKYDGKPEILTASQAARRYPEVFEDSSRKRCDMPMRSILLRVPADMYLFCCRKGSITNYIRSLITNDMGE